MVEFQNDCDVVTAALQADVEACAQISNDENTRWLHSVLMRRGGSATEAADLSELEFTAALAGRVLDSVV